MHRRAFPSEHLSVPSEGWGPSWPRIPGSNEWTFPSTKAGSGNWSSAATHSGICVKFQQLVFSPVFLNLGSKNWQDSLKIHPKRHRQSALGFAPGFARSKPIPMRYDFSDPQNHEGPSAILIFQGSSNQWGG